MRTCTRPHVILQYDRCADFVDQLLVLTGFLTQATVNHRLVRQHRGKALVEEYDGNGGNTLPPTADKLLHPRKVLTGPAIELPRLANHDALHLLTGHVSLQEAE